MLLANIQVNCRPPDRGLYMQFGMLCAARIRPPAEAYPLTRAMLLTVRPLVTSSFTVRPNYLPTTRSLARSLLLPCNSDINIVIVYDRWVIITIRILLLIWKRGVLCV